MLEVEGRHLLPICFFHLVKLELDHFLIVIPTILMVLPKEFLMEKVEMD